MANRNQMTAARAAARKAAFELLRATGVPTTGVSEIRKAKSDPPVACFDSQGRLIGFADPDDVQPVSEEAPPEPGTPAHMQEIQDANAVGPKQHPKSGAVVSKPAPVNAPPTAAVGSDGRAATDEAEIQKADARFRSLLREGDSAQDRELRNGVARIATKLAYDNDVPIREALYIAKSSVVAAAASSARAAVKHEAVADAHRLAARNVIAYVAIRDRYRPITG